MAIDFNPNNVDKVKSLIQRNPQLNVTDNTQADYVDNFKKADADGNGQITRDEFKRYAKDVVSSSVDLSMFGTGETQLADFDAALGDWFDSLDQAGEAAPAAAVSEKPSALPPLDPGKTYALGREDKIAKGEELNFGHNQVDGELWKMQDGSPVWADTGTQVTREQLAAMPDYQVKKFYQMMGLGYDPKVDFPDASERQKLANKVIIPDPGFPEVNHVLSALQNLRIDLDSVHTAISDRESKLQSQLKGADPANRKQIQAQLAQLGGFKAHVETMRAEIQNYQLPNPISLDALDRAEGAIKQIQGEVKRLAGATASERPQIMANFALQMNQLRQPERDLQKDPLAQNQFIALTNAGRALGALNDRMDQLVRQKAGSDGATSAQIDAQLAQLMNVYQGISQVYTPLFSYRPDAALTDQQGQEKAALIDQVDSQIKRMAGLDAAEFQQVLEQAKKQLQGL